LLARTPGLARLFAEVHAGEEKFKEFVGNVKNTSSDVVEEDTAAAVLPFCVVCGIRTVSAALPAADDANDDVVSRCAAFILKSSYFKKLGDSRGWVKEFDSFCHGKRATFLLFVLKPAPALAVDCRSKFEAFVHVLL
jgi:hypothetical protein